MKHNSNDCVTSQVKPQFSVKLSPPNRLTAILTSSGVILHIRLT